MEKLLATFRKKFLQKTPLYRVEHFYQGMDMTTLFGPHASATDFNDDAIGRMLDRMAE